MKIAAILLMAGCTQVLAAPTVIDHRPVIVPEYDPGECRMYVPPVISPSTDENCSRGNWSQGRYIYVCDWRIKVDCDVNNFPE